MGVLRAARGAEGGEADSPAMPWWWLVCSSFVDDLSAAGGIFENSRILLYLFGTWTAADASSGKKRISLSDTFDAGVGPFPVDLSRQRARSDLSDRRGCPLIQTCLRRAAPSMAPFHAPLQQVGVRVRVRDALRANTCGSRHMMARLWNRRRTFRAVSLIWLAQ